MRTCGIESAFETISALRDSCTWSADDATDGAVGDVMREILFGP
jgi:hypothetical protein